MTAPLGLPPRWPDALGCRCEDGPREKPRMESLGGPCRDSLGGPCRDSLGGHCREMLPHGAPGAAPPAADGAAFAELAGSEPARQCPSGSLGYGYPAFGPGYYGCRLNLQQKPCGGFHPPEKFAEPGASLAAEELPARAKEFAFYPGFPGSYQAVPGYLDVSVVPALGAHPEPRHEALLPMEGGYQPWALPNAWDGQVYCSKEQPQSAHLWKSPFPEFPDSSVELGEIWDLLPENKGKTASSCSREVWVGY
ncbi:homeobox protein Hox-C13 [Chamaea fasciata]|uniref:homeobox protein Hox-C13 n=1 Tax=Chamaea fasciata TaxID=190680 RepID=UPI00336A6814